MPTTEVLQNGGNLTNGNAISSPKKVSVVLGAQWGDEGKGKIVDKLSEHVDIVARCQGGANAGHTVVVGGKTYDFHLLPVGIIRDRIAVIGNGVVVHLPSLFKEIEKAGINDWDKKLLISNKTHLVFDFHMLIDGAQESQKGEKKIGTTKRGIGPAYASKVSRTGIRMGDLVSDFNEFTQKYMHLYEAMKCQYEDTLKDHSPEEELTKLKEYSEILKKTEVVSDTETQLNRAVDEQKQILVEGANGTLLDIDFGTFPYVTSSNCSIGGVCTGLGLAPSLIGDVIAIVKAYQTRVGDGPFPTEQINEEGERLRSVGHEFGVTTGRPRRCGWLDLVLLKKSHRLNRFTNICLTKLDVLTGFEPIRVAVAYKLDGVESHLVPSRVEDVERIEVVYKEFPGWSEDISKARSFQDLPETARNYVTFIENFLGVRVGYIGVGKDREALIER